MTKDSLNTLYTALKVPELFGRYITNSHIETCFNKLPFQAVSILGYSVQKRPIYGLKFGTGKTRVLLWSQMHGNESSTTKALFDCFNGFISKSKPFQTILNTCTVFVIPILNPDGAKAYTRFNANGVDLNRDAQQLSQPESKLLRQVYTDFKPNYCFNLHGQRTIYNVGTTNVSATLSFLSPSQNSDCDLTENRISAMAIISEINALMQTQIPNGIARYDDTFNLNCVGDTFQSFGVPTLLFEAGHYPNDYNREHVRRLLFMAIIKGLDVIAKGVNTTNYKRYFSIPENAKCFYDIIIRNAKIDNSASVLDIGIQYIEKLVDTSIVFVPKIEVISKLDTFYGHKEIDAKHNTVKIKGDAQPKVYNEIDFVIINNEKIALKP